MFRLLFALLLLPGVWPVVADAAPIELRRGVGVHEWLNWSPLAGDGTYRWPPYRSQDEWRGGARPLSDWPPGDEFARIRSLGFDFVRLSIDPGPLLANDGARRHDALAILAAAVAQITANDLKVVFDLHGVRQVPAFGMDLIQGGADTPGVAYYRRMVMDVAAMLAEIGADKVALEPFNEPAYYPCDASGTDDWQRIMAATVSDIRAVSPDLTIIVTGACGGSITGLTNLDPAFDDPNLYYSFHMYEPHAFTHQRADNPDVFLSGLPWPAGSDTRDHVTERLKQRMRSAGLNKAQQAAGLATVLQHIDSYFHNDWGMTQMQSRLDEAAHWADRNGIARHRLFMGEFGAMLMSRDGRSGAADADRLRYLAALRLEAEQRGFAWSIWEYANPHGMSVIHPEGPAIPDFALLDALGLP